MILKNGMKLDHRHKVTEYGGARGFVAWVDASYSPVRWFVRGDSWENAYANLLDSEWFVEVAGIKVERDDLTSEEWAALTYGECVSGLEWNGSGVPVWTENLQMVELS